MAQEIVESTASVSPSAVTTQDVIIDEEATAAEEIIPPAAAAGPSEAPAAAPSPVPAPAPVEAVEPEPAPAAPVETSPKKSSYFKKFKMKVIREAPLSPPSLLLYLSGTKETRPNEKQAHLSHLLTVPYCRRHPHPTPSCSVVQSPFGSKKKAAAPPSASKNGSKGRGSLPRAGTVAAATASLNATSNPLTGGVRVPTETANKDEAGDETPLDDFEDANDGEDENQGEGKNATEDAASEVDETGAAEDASAVEVEAKDDDVASPSDMEVQKAEDVPAAAEEATNEEVEEGEVENEGCNEADSMAISPEKASKPAEASTTTPIGSPVLDLTASPSPVAEPAAPASPRITTASKMELQVGVSASYPTRLSHSIPPPWTRTTHTHPLLCSPLSGFADADVTCSTREAAFPRDG